jgi:hypothetical protein
MTLFTTPLQELQEPEEVDLAAVQVTLHLNRRLHHMLLQVAVAVDQETVAVTQALVIVKDAMQQFPQMERLPVTEQTQHNLDNQVSVPEAPEEMVVVQQVLETQLAEAQDGTLLVDELCTEPLLRQHYLLETVAAARQLPRSLAMVDLVAADRQPWDRVVVAVDIAVVVALTRARIGKPEVAVVLTRLRLRRTIQFSQQQEMALLPLHI